jgi:hypothetical protein
LDDFSEHFVDSAPAALASCLENSINVMHIGHVEVLILKHNRSNTEEGFLR